MRVSRIIAMGVVFGVSAAASVASAHGRHGGGDCCVPCEAPAPKMVEKTIMVPQCVTEKRKVTCTEYTQETREKTVTVMKPVPKTETVTREYTVMVPKQMTKTVTHQVCKPVVKEETVEYTVAVPHKQTREGVHKVCKRVAVPMTKTVKVDEGHWEKQAPAEDACGSTPGCDSGCGHRRHRRRCGSCGSCGSAPCQVWVPNIVEKEVNYTCYKTVTEDKPYTYEVTVCKPETRTKTVQRTHYVTEPETREVTYTKCVAEKRTKTCEVTRVECVPTERTVSYTVCVPHKVEKEVEVNVVKMVPKTITVPEGCGSCYHARRCRRCGGC